MTVQNNPTVPVNENGIPTESENRDLDHFTQFAQEKYGLSEGAAKLIFSRTNSSENGPNSFDKGSLSEEQFGEALENAKAFTETKQKLGVDNIDQTSAILLTGDQDGRMASDNVDSLIEKGYLRKETGEDGKQWLKTTEKGEKFASYLIDNGDLIGSKDIPDHLNDYENGVIGDEATMTMLSGDDDGKLSQEDVNKLVEKGYLKNENGKLTATDKGNEFVKSLTENNRLMGKEDMLSLVQEHETTGLSKPPGGTNDGTFTKGDYSQGGWQREGTDGSYAQLDNGSVFYSGDENVPAQILRDGEWNAASPDEVKLGNESILNLKKNEEGNGFNRNGYEGTYGHTDDGNVYYSGGKSPTGSPAAPQILENGSWRPATEDEIKANNEALDIETKGGQWESNEVDAEDVEEMQENADEAAESTSDVNFKKARENIESTLGSKVDSKDELNTWLDKNEFSDQDKDSLRNVILKGEDSADIEAVEKGLDELANLKKESSKEGSVKEINAFGSKQKYTSVGDGKHWKREDGEVFAIEGFNGNGDLDLKKVDKDEFEASQPKPDSKDIKEQIKNSRENIESVLGSGVDSKEELDSWLDKNGFEGDVREDIKNAILRGDDKAGIHEVDDGLDSYLSLHEDGGKQGAERKINAFGEEHTYTSVGDNKHWVRDDGKVFEINGFNGDGNLDLKKTEDNVSDDPKSYIEGTFVSVNDDGKVEFFNNKEKSEDSDTDDYKSYIDSGKTIDNITKNVGSKADSEDELVSALKDAGIKDEDIDNVKNSILKGEDSADSDQIKQGLERFIRLQTDANTQGSERKINAFGDENTYTAVGDGKHWVRDDGQVFEINGFNGSGNLDMKKTNDNVSDKPQTYGDVLVSFDDDKPTFKSKG